MACENKEQATVDIVEVDAAANKVNTAASPMAAEVTPPPVSTKSNTSSKPAKKRITPIAIN
jgi:chromatin assembly factor 1 subunit B